MFWEELASPAKVCRVYLMEIYLVAVSYVMALSCASSSDWTCNLTSIPLTLWLATSKESFSLLTFWDLVFGSILLNPKTLAQIPICCKLNREPSSITIVNDEGASWENRRRNYTFKACWEKGQKRKSSNSVIFFHTHSVAVIIGNLKTMFLLPAWHHTHGHSSLPNVYLKRDCTKRSSNVTCI